VIYLVAQIWLGLLVACILGAVLGHWVASLGRSERYLGSAPAPRPSRPAFPDVRDLEERAEEAEARAAEAEAALAEAGAGVAEAEARAAEAELAATDARGRLDETTERMHDAERRATAWEERSAADADSLAEARDRLAEQRAEFDRLDARVKDAVDLQEKLSSSHVPAITDEAIGLREELNRAASERAAAVSERDEAAAERDALVSERDEAVSERDAAILQRDAALDQRDVAVLARDAATTAGEEAVARAEADADRIQELEMKLTARRAEVAELSARLQTVNAAPPEPASSDPADPIPGPGGGAYGWAETASPPTPTEGDERIRELEAARDALEKELEASREDIKRLTIRIDALVLGGTGNAGMNYLVDDVEGIGPIFAARLAEAGIRDTSDLLAATCTPEGRDALAVTIQGSPATLLDWARQADLMRVDGVGPQYSELLRAADVGGLADLAAADAEELTQRMAGVNLSGGRRIARRLPDAGSVADWIASAAKLTSRVQI